MVCVQFKLVYSLFVVPIVTGFFSVLGMAIERFQAFAVYRDQRQVTRKFSIAWFMSSWTLAICFVVILIAQIEELDENEVDAKAENFNGQEMMKRHHLVSQLFPGPHIHVSEIQFNKVVVNEPLITQKTEEEVVTEEEKVTFNCKIQISGLNCTTGVEQDFSTVESDAPNEDALADVITDDAQGDVITEDALANVITDNAQENGGEGGEVGEMVEASTSSPTRPTPTSYTSPIITPSKPPTPLSTPSSTTSSSQAIQSVEVLLMEVSKTTTFTSTSKLTTTTSPRTTTTSTSKTPDKKAVSPSRENQTAPYFKIVIDDSEVLSRIGLTRQRKGRKGRKGRTERIGRNGRKGRQGTIILETELIANGFAKSSGFSQFLEKHLGSSAPLTRGKVEEDNIIECGRDPEKQNPTEFRVICKSRPVAAGQDVVATTTKSIEALNTNKDTEQKMQGKCRVKSTIFVSYYFILLFLLCFATPVLITTSLNVFITTAVRNTHHEIISHHQWLTLAACVIMWGPCLTELLLSKWEIVHTPQPLSVFLFLLGHTHNLLRSILHAVFAQQMASFARMGFFNNQAPRKKDKVTRVAPAPSTTTAEKVKKFHENMEIPIKRKDTLVPRPPAPGMSNSPPNPRRSTVPDIEIHQVIETTCT